MTTYITYHQPIASSSFVAPEPLEHSRVYNALGTPSRKRTHHEAFAPVEDNFLSPCKHARRIEPEEDGHTAYPESLLLLNVDRCPPRIRRILGRDLRLYHTNHTIQARSSMAGEFASEQEAPSELEDIKAHRARTNVTSPTMHRCRWTTRCKSLIAATPTAVREHLRSAHNAELPTSNAVNKRVKKITCKWSGCKYGGTPLRPSSLPAHVVAVHLRT